ncbi:hypothetical protein SODALDRAFT_377135 [Sodiomyces alkalinus F11]|uniref:PLP-dependent transferase n=1 Tax=Sodiomyces alkalinus (strain CBS 110278 / VKM F-3762 / F11) TaxID=1314773 RepID=A0A3N2Q4D0_SODAK|nr:hypothetical protein SODALDRAFT_377135 [Sodiomyces alkalinus F11]ROT41465.1 hypothetical protein SODALDRAFT_377135 [Sodiomyces alkalinus F11]
MAQFNSIGIHPREFIYAKVMVQGSAIKKAGQPAATGKPKAASTRRQPNKVGKKPQKAKMRTSADKMQKKFAGALTAKTEKMLGERAGHLELIGKGKKGNDKKGNDDDEGTGDYRESFPANASGYSTIFNNLVNHAGSERYDNELLLRGAHGRDTLLSFGDNSSLYKRLYHTERDISIPCRYHIQGETTGETVPNSESGSAFFLLDKDADRRDRPWDKKFNSTITVCPPNPDGVHSTFASKNSRRFRALPAYAVLRSEGRAGMAAMLGRMVRLARKIAAFVRDSHHYEWLPDQEAEADLEDTHIIVLFRAKDEALNDVLVAKINETREVFVSGTVWNGKAVRIAVATRRVDVERGFAVVREVLDSVAEGRS